MPRASTRASASHREWSEESKRALIARGYATAEAELAAHGIDLMESDGLARLSRLPAELDRDRGRLRTAIELDLHGLAGLVVGEQVAQLFE